MGIKYEHLEDGTPYVALALNQRVAAATQTLNALTRDNVAEGAFRTDQLPSPIGVAQRPAARDELTKTIDVKHTDNLGAHTYASGNFINTPKIEFRDAINLSDANQSVDALIVLANIHVHRFLKSNGDPVTTLYIDGPGSLSGHYGFEDGFTARFELYVVYSDLSKELIPWANRTISPGLTISELAHGNSSGTAKAGKSYIDGSGAFTGDNDSYKDVAIRAVITRNDYAELGLRPIKGLQLRVANVIVYPAARRKYATSPGTGSVVLGKTVFSAIPIQCGVSDG